MKLATNFPNSIKAYFTIILLLVFAVLANAQQIHYREPFNPAKGYWKLYTDAATRTTSVKFFDVYDKIFYEEVIPEKYIKLTYRNINKINKAFDQATGNYLVQTKVKSNALPLSTNRPNLNKENTRNVSNSGIILNGFKYANTTNYCLIYKNPARKSVHISLTDEEGKALYSEYTSIADYHRIFHFNGLHPGRYTLVVGTTNHKYKYTEQLSISPKIQTLQVEPVNPTFEQVGLLISREQKK